MPIYIVRAIQGGKTLARKQITKDAGRDPMVLQAQADVTYVLSDTIHNLAPSKIAARRHGKNLLITFDGSTTDVPDLIIEGYFDYPPAPVKGALSNGEYSNYDLSALGSAAATDAPATAPTEAIQATLQQPPNWWSDNKWLIGGALGAVALGVGASGGGGSSDDAAPAADVVALEMIKKFANDSSQPAPQVKDYSSAGITGVNAGNLAAMNNAIENAAATSVDSKDEVQNIVNAYTKVLAAATNSTTTTPQIDVNDFVTIGADIGLAKTNPAHFELLKSVIGSMTASRVDSLAEINTIATAVDKVMNVAAGQASTLTVQDFANLGIATSGSSAVTAANLSSISSAIASAGGQANVDSFSELNNLVKAVATIYNYASDSNQAVPTLSHYTALGITGVVDTNLSAINSAVSALTENEVSTRAQLQTVVDAYTAILAEANGSSSDATPNTNPTVQQFAAIGANIGQAVNQASNLSLLNDVIGNLSLSQVNTVAKINALAMVVDQIMNQATGQASTLSVADLALIGLPTSGAGAVTTANLSAIQQAIGSAGGSTKVDSYTELSGIITAQATIFNYANDNTQAIPSAAQYNALGISGVNANNVAAINNAIDSKTGAEVDSKAELQAIVDAYNAILTEANGSAADATPTQDPSAAQYALIGADIGAAGSNSVHLALLNDTVGQLATTAVSTIAQINEVASATNAVLDTAAGGSTAVSAAQLALLGITGVTSNNLIAIQQAIVRTADDGSQVNSMSALQTLVTSAANSAAASQTVIQNYATNNTNPAPSLNDYTNIGVIGVTADNLASINSQIDALSGTDVATAQQVQALLDQQAQSIDLSNVAAIQRAMSVIEPSAFLAPLSPDELSVLMGGDMLDQSTPSTPDDGVILDTLNWEALGLGGVDMPVLIADTTLVQPMVILETPSNDDQSLLNQTYLLM